MPRQPHTKTPNRHYLALALAAVLGAPGAALAQDSGAGIDLQFGNPLDPTGQNLHDGCTPGGNSWLNDERKHTPTGAMYACRPDYPDFKTGQAWRYRGTIGVGYLAVSGDEDNMAWRRFSNFKDGGIFSANLRFEKPVDGKYVDVRSSFINQDSYYLRAVFGQAGKYRVQAFARAMSNVTSGNARSIWDGVGTNHLTLKSGLTPATSTHAQVAAVSAASPERILSVVRDKQGVGISYYLNPRWTFYGNASHESREGARPFGGPFFFSSFGGIYETPRPIDDSTVNFSGGARFTGKKWRMNFSYTGSFFRNAYSSFDYEVPFPVHNVVPGTTSPPIGSGVFAYEPENDYHNLRASFTRKVAKNGEFSLALSGSRSRQNDGLIPHTACQGQLGIPIPGRMINCADWNTTAALSRQSADLAINSQMVDMRLVMQPTDKFTWRITARHQRDDYSGTYNSYNPLTGQWGYIAENGAQGSAIPGEMGIWDPGVFNSGVLTRVRNLPLDKQTQQVVLGGDWQLNAKNTLGASYTYDRMEHTNREVTTSRDNSVKLTWNNRALEWLTFRANYTWMRRSGNAYNEDPYEFTFSSSLPGYVPPATGTPAHTVAQLRKYDVGDLTRNKLYLQAMFTLPHDMTLSAQVRGERNDYDAELGRTAWDTYGTSLQWDWQPTSATVASAWYGFDRSDLDIANVNDLAMLPDPNLGGPSYPNANRWWMTDKQRNHYAGASLSQRIKRATLTADWNYISSRGDTSYRYNSAGALSVPADAVPGLAGTFPEMRWRINTLTVGVNFPINDRLNLRLFDTWQKGSLFDWHYSGFDNGQVIGTMVYTDGGPENYSVNMVGLMMEMKL
ncbi:MAG: MtrB/PioB family outer membrane beta-barrel protein [Xanthomonadaceae bacterium]|nr:MtrB/PioB family outer membrane beta-barrel protein [Xanthomonadaceae bacterium]